jgi:dephospho-CoA kinase
MIIIGLTGRNAAGKTTAGETLGTRGFSYLSLSDVIREEAKQRGHVLRLHEGDGATQAGYGRDP